MQFCRRWRPSCKLFHITTDSLDWAQYDRTLRIAEPTEVVAHAQWLARGQRLETAGGRRDDLARRMRERLRACANEAGEVRAPEDAISRVDGAHAALKQQQRLVARRRVAGARVGRRQRGRRAGGDAERRRTELREQCRHEAGPVCERDGP